MQVASSLFNIRSSPVFARCESNQRFSRRWIVGSKILPARSCSENQFPALFQ